MDIVVCIRLFLCGIFSAGSPSPKKNTWEKESSGEPARKFYYPEMEGII